MTGYFPTAGAFLITFVFGFYILSIMLRFLLQAVRADFYNPLSQFLVKITNPPLRPLRRIIPGLGGLDMAAVALMLALQMLEMFLLAMLAGASMHPWVLFVLALTELLSLLLYVFLFSILILVVVSWIAPHAHNPVTGLVRQLTAPLMRPIQRRVPVFSGLDLSPLIALVVLNLLIMAIPYLRASLISLM